MITCPNCGRQNEDHYKFCLGCGTGISAAAAPEPEPEPVPVCPQCSAPTSPEQRFCGSCGFGLPEPADTAPPAAAPPAAAPPAAAPPAAAPPAAAPPAAAPAGSSPQLIMINPDGSPGDAFTLAPGENMIGRATNADVFSRDAFLSPKHATFEVRAEECRIVDLGSLNGVYYRITEATEIVQGDLIRIGRELLKFEVLAQAEPRIASTDGATVAGSNPMGAWGRLERISAPEVASIAFMLRGNEQFLGRERGDILFRDDGYVSGKHARVFSDGGRYFVEDLNSSNGTFIRIRGERILPIGSLILMGQQPFRIQP